MSEPQRIPPLVGATKIADCEKHGTYESRRYPFLTDAWSPCPICLEESEAERQRQEAERHRLQMEDLWDAAMARAGIPARFRGKRLEDYVAVSEAQQANLAWAVDYAHTFDIALHTGRSALLVGKPGTGKTHLALAIAQHVMRRQCSVRFSTVQRVFRAVKETWSREAETSEAQAVAMFTKPDLLILDEVGVQFGSATEQQLLFDILNHRYESMKPTLLLSNLPVAEVQTFLGERIMDRLREDGGRVLVFDWASHRGQAQ